MVISRISLFIFFTAFITQVNAQVSFSADSEKYLEQAEDYMGQYDRKEAKKFIEEFKPVWAGISGGIKSDVYQYSNTLVAKGAKPYPEFWAYLTAIKKMGENNLLTTVYEGWKNTLSKTFDARDKKQYSEFLVFSMGFFKDGFIYQTSGQQWKTTGTDYRFDYENNQPKVTYTKTDLKCYAKNDSSVVYKTSGVLFPLKEKFNGTGGIVTWERAGLSKEETYAELKKYDVSLKSVGFNADSVTFHTTYFKLPLAGKMDEKIVSLPKTQAATYPQFQSYSRRLFIKNIFNNIDYEGGFQMQGASLLGYGTSNEMAQMILYRNNVKFMKSLSTLFTIKPESVDAEKAQAVIYIEKDSISHIFVRFKYQKSENKVTLSRNKDGLSQSPFSNTYHKIDMYFEAITWKLDDPVMEFGSLFMNTDKSARFESSNFFSINKYNEIQGMDPVHPMVPIEQLSIRKDTTHLSLAEVASFMGKPTSQILPVIGALNSGGYISYDPDNEIVVVKKKLYDYLKARAKKIDYDPIDFDSDVDGVQANATLNLLSYDLTVRGVKKVNLSDSQFVRIYPDKQELVLKKNRDMKFSGIVNAGSTEFFGKEFFFSYADYKIDLLQCDSMRLRVWPFDGRGEKQIRVKSVIRGVKGSITIDGKENKSGLKKGFEKYPILNSTQPTYVFYNDKSIHKGVYDSSSFYFKVDAFVMDSLDNFRPKAQRFAGEFKSAGIFPVFREELYIQKDYSLGFIRKAPPEGLKMYGDKAIFKNEIRLSNKGLQADGVVNFLTATAESKEFTLFPDSLAGLAQKFVNIEQKSPHEVPETRGVHTYVRYVPKQKVMYASSTDSLINFFGTNETKLKGTLALRPEGMTGKGRMYFEKAEISSRNFKYKTKVIDADTSAFKLKNIEADGGLSFKTDNVNAHIDFVKREGEFTSNGEESFVEFPENQYICYMDRFRWFMDSEDLQLESDRKSATGIVTIDTDLDLSGSNFFSVHPDQDSLNFMAPKARYDLKSKIISCTKVDFIIVGDARIYPDSAKVTIQKKAKLDILNNAKIVANNTTKYHTIFNARVEIKARKKYQAEGDYIYRDENKLEQKIHFANISLDTTYQTYAKGEIKEEEKFMLSPHFEYKGGIELKAVDIGLNFDGGVRLVHSCNSISRNWFAFKAVIDPQNIAIPVNDVMVNYEGGLLSAGISLNTTLDSIGIYPTFLSSKLKKEHPDLLATTGFLVFDKRLQEYQIASMDKLKERSLPGNFISFTKEKCVINGDGKMNFGMDFGQVKVTPIGNMTHTITDHSSSMQVSMSINFPFSNDAMEKVAEKINNFPDLQPFDFTKSNYEKALRELIGIEKADKVVADLSLHGEVKRFPPELAATIVIADVKMVWVPNEACWISEGKIGLSNLFKKQVFKYVDGAIYIKKGTKYDEIRVVLALDENTIYYFTYKNNTGMEVASTDESFNNVILETKEDKMKFKGEKGERDFEYRFNKNKLSQGRQWPEWVIR